MFLIINVKKSGSRKKSKSKKCTCKKCGCKKCKCLKNMRKHSLKFGYAMPGLIPGF